MNFLRNSFSSLIAAVFVPVFVTFLLLNNFGNVLLSEETFNQTMKENQAYEKLGAIFPVTLSFMLSSDSDVRMPAEVLDKVINQIDQNRLQKDIEVFITSSYRYVTSKSDSLNVTIDVKPYVEALKNDLKPALTDYLNNLPACTPEQEQALASNEQQKVLECMPANTSTEQILANFEIDQLINDASTKAPEKLIITENGVELEPSLTSTENQIDEKTQEEGYQNSFKQARDGVNALRGSISLTLFWSIILALLIFVSRLKNFVSGFRWLGSVGVIASVLPLLLATLVLISLDKERISNELPKSLGFTENNPLEKEAVGLVSEIVISFLQKIFQGVQIQALVVLVISVALIVLSFVLAMKLKKKTDSPLDVKMPISK